MAHPDIASPKLRQVPELEKEVLDSKVVHWRQCQVQKPLQLGGERLVGRTRTPPKKKKTCDLWNPLSSGPLTLDVQRCSGHANDFWLFSPNCVSPFFSGKNGSRPTPPSLPGWSIPNSQLVTGKTSAPPCWWIPC